MLVAHEELQDTFSCECFPVPSCKKRAQVEQVHTDFQDLGSEYTN